MRGVPLSLPSALSRLSLPWTTVVFSPLSRSLAPKPTVWVVEQEQKQEWKQEHQYLHGKRRAAPPKPDPPRLPRHLLPPTIQGGGQPRRKKTLHLGDTLPPVPPHRGGAYQHSRTKSWLEISRRLLLLDHLLPPAPSSRSRHLLLLLQARQLQPRHPHEVRSHTSSILGRHFWKCQVFHS